MTADVRNQSEQDATASVDDYIRQLVACARALPQKNWEWRQFLRPNGEPIETVEHVCEAQNHSASVSDVAELWGVNYGPDTPVVCYTGNGPYSAKHAQYFAAVQPGAMIWILDELGERISGLTEALQAIRRTEWRTDSDGAMRGALDEIDRIADAGLAFVENK